MPNLGEMHLDVLVESGDAGALTIQAADVRKPLLAVSSLNKKGNPVWFDNENSYIVPSTAKNSALIRHLLREVENMNPLHLNNRVFTMKSWSKASPFRGQGK